VKGKLSGKIAIVTGASGGIGQGLAIGLAAAGATVAVNYKTNRAGAAQTLAVIGQAGGEGEVFQADIGAKGAFEAMIASVVQRFGGLDGGNSAALELACRRVIIETDALATAFTWWNLLPADFVSSVRQSVFPGGAGRAGEIETSVYLYLAPEKVQMDKARNHIAWYNQRSTSSFQWGDLFGSGPVSVFERTSTFTEDGTFGQATLATAEKGKVIFDQAVSRLVEFVREFQNRPARPAVDHHTNKPTSPLPKA
jgi:creatinine amidohydrolase/short subunit dehydrogenase